MDYYIDLHTHRQPPQEGVIAVYNHLLHDKTVAPGCLFSAGLHPWYADKMSLDVLSASLDQLSSGLNMVAFGETGLDKVREIPLQVQRNVVELHLKKPVDHHKPLFIPCVKAWDAIDEIPSGYPVVNFLH